MSHASTKKIDGFVAPGGYVPYLDPFKLVVVGHDVPETPDTWFTHCGRLVDLSPESLKRYAEEIVAAGRVDNIVKSARNGNRLLVLDGRRTTIAGRMARDIQAAEGVPEDERVAVRVEMVQGNEEDYFRVNIDSHKHVPLTRTQHARNVLAYYRRVKEDAAKTAAFFRVHVHTIRVMLKHFDLSAKAQRMIDDGEIPATLTKKLAALSRGDQDALLEEMREMGATKGAKAGAAVAKANGETVKRAPSRKFLTKWKIEFQKVESAGPAFVNIVDVIDFFLGGPLPTPFREGVYAEILERAGYKPPTV